MYYIIKNPYTKTPTSKPIPVNIIGSFQDHYFLKEFPPVNYELDEKTPASFYCGAVHKSELYTYEQALEQIAFNYVKKLFKLEEK